MAENTEKVELREFELDAIFVSEYNNNLTVVLKKLREGWNLDRRIQPNPVVIDNQGAIYHLFHEIKKTITMEKTEEVPKVAKAENVV